MRILGDAPCATLLDQRTVARIVEASDEEPRTAVIGPGDPIRLPPGVGRVDHEAELGVVLRS